MNQKEFNKAIVILKPKCVRMVIEWNGSFTIIAYWSESRASRLATLDDVKNARPWTILGQVA